MKKIIYMLLFSLFPLYSFAQNEYVDAIVERNNQFAVDYYKVFNTPGENIVLSPFGISNCMAMAYIGSEGATQEQIAKSMH
ncbi:MAG: hypothetical protein DRJ10_08895, partial [Bacteroidetes bacterium]